MSNNEMLPADIFTRPRGWRARLYVKDLLDNSKDDFTGAEVVAIGKAFAKALREEPLFERDDLITAFENARDLTTFNLLMDAMYDECDRARILVQ